MEIVKLKFYWSLGEDICEKQKQYKWDANFMKRLSLDLRAEFPQSEGFSRTNLYDIKRCFAFYSSQLNLSTRLVDNYRKWMMPICLDAKETFRVLVFFFARTKIRQ
ncbi:DUF1016 family protein [Segatella hominis]|uniref:DUF1016 family protein n=1 Tax=Segatella hominis TaxID=2518605 RepID=A0A4Y8VL39_9BACT|nr:DUF1016 family protein [Segatella hominis]